MKYLTVLANLILIGFILWMFATSYNSDRVLALLFLVPPVLSLMAISRGPDLEERRLINQVRKAQLRKELKELAEFTEEKK
ncbi:MAG: hypothetical protein KDI13_04555 [Alphaproteobacteria bacterium]|nr:hypothetical protein [Alphaproteobacteria bacterium]